MYRPRVIPVLLLKGSGLVKSIKFKSHKYIGDPINASRLFDEFGADEIVLLDITASKRAEPISLNLVRSLGDELSIPFSVGGGITKLQEIEERLESGAERVILNTIATRDLDFVRLAVNHFGSSSIAVCVDVKIHMWHGWRVYSHVESRCLDIRIEDYIRRLQAHQVGEIIIQSIDRDGTMGGYDKSLVKLAVECCQCPVVALGGAVSVDDIHSLGELTSCSGYAAGSIFLYGSKNRGVLINYPDSLTLRSIR